MAASDISSTSQYMDSIQYVTGKGIMKGYADGTFRPKQILNRAELLKILVESKLGTAAPVSMSACFQDVPSSAWYAASVCYAKSQAWVSGYSDGQFRPSQQISLAEAGKLMMEIFDIPETAMKVGIGAQPWYASSLIALSSQHIIPDSFGYVGQVVQRDQIAEMLHRFRENISDRSFVPYEQMKSGACLMLGEHLPTNIDLKKIRDTWLGWNNAARAANGLAPYGYSFQLARTATAWSEVSKKRGYMDHKRDGQTAYYDYNRMLQWFKNLGMTFKNVNTVTFTENIGWSPYSCTKADCTAEVIKAIRYSFDFYMAEKNDAYRPHYNSLMSKYFKEIGVGLAIDETKKKLYLTIHYAVQPVVALPICRG